VAQLLGNLILKKFRIQHYSDGKFWITHNSGEAGEFDIDKFEDVIQKFYEDNF